MRVVDRRIFKRIRGRLRRLYGEDLLPRLLNRLELVIGRYGVELSCDEPQDCRHWDERDAVLITYGDMVRAEGESTLGSLSAFLRENVGDAVSAVHILPFLPFSSDDGFAVKDFRVVDQELGGWGDIRGLARDYRLMVDLILNHVSSSSHWFQSYCNGLAPEREYFIEVDPNADLSAVVRPRASPLLRSVQTPYGERHVWTTFSADQVDCNFGNADVLFEFLDILLFYVSNGARMIRLDAVAYLWKEVGTPCIHLQQTHEVVKLLRDLLDLVEPGTILISETNVPHAENIAYFGSGDEAHVVYQFSLPPLLLHALHSGDGSFLTRWAMDLEAPPPGCTFLNFTASHDGIGVRPLEGLLPDQELQALMRGMEERGGLVSSRTGEDGSTTPYEINISYFDAVGVPGDPEASVDRFLCSQTIAMSLQGIPGIYFNSLLGAGNDLKGVELTGQARSINRRKWGREELDLLLSRDAGHQASRIFPEYLRRLHLRAEQAAFDPAASQRVLNLPAGLFGVQRVAPADGQRLWMVANLTGSPLQVAFQELDERWQGLWWSELIDGWRQAEPVLPPKFELGGYQVAWLVASVDQGLAT